MAKRWAYDIIAVTGKYTGSDGNEKANWGNFGRGLVDDSDDSKITLEMKTTLNLAGLPHDSNSSVVYLTLAPHKSVSK